VSTKISRSKNDRFTLGQPDVRGTSTITAATTKIVLTVAIPRERRRCALS
jgi:hypothetical protein